MAPPAAPASNHQKHDNIYTGQSLYHLEVPLAYFPPVFSKQYFSDQCKNEAMILSPQQPSINSSPLSDGSSSFGKCTTLNETINELCPCEITACKLFTEGFSSVETAGNISSTVTSSTKENMSIAT
mmetsp:Transcript_28640/g.41009  ORF Transcript_28640/g.41009 Transcript_28640/m.41009 type:complete len:126 (-) Transcript_28640:74-451(-)